MARTWFTADTHLGHVNIVDYCQRPFTKPATQCRLHDAHGDRRFYSRVQGNTVRPCSHPDVEVMNRTIIERWNAKVAPDDTVYHLGDFAFGNLTQVRTYFEQLNGRKALILGNHDRLKPRQYEEMGFLVRRKLRLGHLWLVHRPPSPLEAPGGVVLHGHIHGLWTHKKTPTSTLINVGVDVRDFAPVSLTELGLSEVEAL